MRKQNYSKKVFAHNIEVLVKYNWEPELEIYLTNGQRVMIIVYRDFIEYINENGNCLKFKDIKDMFRIIKWKKIKH